MSTKQRAHITIYQAADGWRWRMRAGNRRIVADSGEAYKRRDGAWRAAQRVRELAMHTTISY